MPPRSVATPRAFNTLVTARNEIPLLGCICWTAASTLGRKRSAFALEAVHACLLYFGPPRFHASGF
jgi:hypothetical protein